MLSLRDTRKSYFTLVRRASIPIALLLGIFWYVQGFHAVTIKQTFPKRANYFLSWTVSEQQARELAQWDLLVLDAEVQERNPESLQLIRKLNPDIVILAYVTSQDLRQDAGSLRTISPLRYQRWSEIPQKWYLKNAQGQKLSWWPGMDLLNISTAAPMHNGQRYYQYLATHVVNEILSTAHWDGVFYDNSWERIADFAGSDINIDGSGGTDTVTRINSAWKDGMNLLYEQTRTLASGRIVLIGNGDSGFTTLNGVMYENFPRYGWRQTLNQYRTFEDAGAEPNTSIVNSNTNNHVDSTDYRAMRFGLASALMGDGFYSFDDGDAHHESLWWYDEYEAFLGEATGDPYRVDAKHNWVFDEDGVWRRDFTHGTVLVNATNSAKTVVLDGEFEHIHGTQDTKANSGRIVSAVSIPAQDGRILLRRIERFYGTSFDNGAFARVFDEYGKTQRNGFFAYEPEEGGGNQVLFDDLEGDGTIEKIVSDETYVYVYEQSGSLRVKFPAYAPTYRGGITIATGNVTGGKAKEIVTGTRNGGGPHIRVFAGDGRLLNGGFFAFHPKFRGGVNVAVGDTNGNGFTEIIAGAGVGGGAHVQVFSGDGRLLSPGFFPFKQTNGGIRVAAADVDGDGDVEIVTGPGPGSPPLVQVFDHEGNQVGESFHAFSKHDRGGIMVGAADFDGDGIDEIMAMTDNVLTISVLGLE